MIINKKKFKAGAFFCIGMAFAAIAVKAMNFDTDSEDEITSSDGHVSARVSLSPAEEVTVFNMFKAYNDGLLTEDVLELLFSQHDALSVKRIIDTTDEFDSEKGNTILHYVVEDGDVDLVRFLLELNVAVDIRNNDGGTAFDLAQQNSVIKELFDDYDDNSF